MTDPTRPPDPVVPTEPTGAEPPPATPTPGASASEPMAAASAAAQAMVNLDAPSQRILGAGAAVVVLAVLGAGVGAMRVDWSAIILMLAGIAAATAAWMTTSGRPVRPMVVAWRDIGLAGASVAAVLGVLFVAEILFDLDDLDDYGGVLGALIRVLVGVAGIALYVLVSRRWFHGMIGHWTAALGAGQATRLILIGAAVVELGWLGNVTVGVWYFEAGVEVLTLVLVAAILARAASDPTEPLAQRPAAAATGVLLILSAIIALQHTLSFVGEGFGLDDWIPQLVYAAGVAIAVAGAAIWALAEFGSALPKMAGDDPGASPPPAPPDPEG